MAKPIQVLLGGLLVLLGIGVYSALFTVDETQQALVLQFGEPREVIQEPGLHVKIPIVQNVIYFDNRLLDFDAEKEEVPTADQRQIVVDAFARYRIDNPLLFYQAVGTEFAMRGQLAVIMNRALRDTFGGVPLLAALSDQRAELMQQTRELVALEGQRYGIEVVDVRVKRVDLPQANSDAIFRRMATQREQEARGLRASGERDAQRIRAEADLQARVIVADAQRDAEILRGEGDAEATRIYAEAYSQDEAFFDFWRSMQAMERSLATDSTTFVGPPQGDFFRFFEDQTGGARALVDQ